MRTAVFVADDAGMDAARNRGILAACEAGVVRAVAILANGPAAPDLAARLLDSGLAVDVGLHLNLTEGRALSGVLPGLTDAAGRFCVDKCALWQRAAEAPLDAQAVEREAGAQIDRLLELGLDVVFANGHQHVHLLPGVRDGLARALDGFPSVRWVRCPDALGFSAEPGSGSAWPSVPETILDERGRGWASQGWQAEAAYAAWGGAGNCLRSDRRRGADALAGLDLVGRLDADAVLDRLDRVRASVPDDGIVEVMVHPGECDPESVRFSGLEAREREAGALCCQQLHEGLGRLGYRVAGFSAATR